MPYVALALIAYDTQCKIDLLNPCLHCCRVVIMVISVAGTAKNYKEGYKLRLSICFTLPLHLALSFMCGMVRDKIRCKSISDK